MKPTQTILIDACTLVDTLAAHGDQLQYPFDDERNRKIKQQNKESNSEKIRGAIIGFVRTGMQVKITPRCLQEVRQTMEEYEKDTKCGQETIQQKRELLNCFAQRKEIPPQIIDPATGKKTETPEYFETQSYVIAEIKKEPLTQEKKELIEKHKNKKPNPLDTTPPDVWTDLQMLLHAREHKQNIYTGDKDISRLNAILDRIEYLEYKKYPHLERICENQSKILHSFSYLGAPINLRSYLNVLNSPKTH